MTRPALVGSREDVVNELPEYHAPDAYTFGEGVMPPFGKNGGIADSRDPAMRETRRHCA